MPEHELRRPEIRRRYKLRPLQGRSREGITAFIEHLQTSLSHGDKVSLPGVGHFEVAERAARQGRNPQTGETVAIPASNAVKFKAGKALKDAVNG